MELLKIGQMARLNGVSEQTLRLYDRIGLLRPEHTDDQTGYRYYDISQCSWLDIIQYMKSLGMQLNEIKEKLDAADAGFIQEMLKQRLEWLEDEEKRIELQKRFVRHAIQIYGQLESYPPIGVMIIERMPARHLYVLCVDEEIYAENEPDHGEERYNRSMRKLRAKMASANLSFQALANFGTIVRGFGRTSEVPHSNEVFAQVDELLADLPEVIHIPAGVYLTVYSNEFAQEFDFSARMLEEARKKGYAICGDYLCEELVMLPTMGAHGRNMFFRLQMPIKFPINKK